MCVCVCHRAAQGTATPTPPFPGCLLIRTRRPHMTSASELFTARRAARGGRLADPGPDPDPHADALRDPHVRRSRRGCRPRRQLDAAGDVRQHLHTGAPPPRRRGSYTVRSLPLPPSPSSSLPLDNCRIACAVVGFRIRAPPPLAGRICREDWSSEFGLHAIR